MLLSAPLSVCAGTTVCTWEASQKPETLADGKVALSYSGDALASVTAQADVGDTIVFDGDAMNLAADARILLDGRGCLVFSNEVAAAGALAVSGNLTNLTFTGKSDTYSSDASTFIFPGAKGLDEYEVDSATVADIPNGSPYFVERTPGEFTVQLQAYSSPYSYAVIARIWEDEDGFHSKSTHGKYTSSGNRVGTDATTWGGNGGYSYQKLVLKGRADLAAAGEREIRFCKTLTRGGEVTVAGRAHVIVTGDALGAKDDAVVEGKIKFDNADFTILDHGRFTDCLYKSGKYGVFEYASSNDDVPYTEDDLKVVWTEPLTTSAQVVLPNTVLSSVTGMTARVRWGAYGSGTGDQGQRAGYPLDLPAAFYGEKGNETQVRFQSQRQSGGLVNCARIVLQQTGNDVTVFQRKGLFVWTSDPDENAYTCDLYAHNVAYDKKSAPDEVPASYYEITNLTFYLSAPTGSCPVAYVTIAGTNKTTKVVDRFRPGRQRALTAFVTSRYGAPAGDKAIVEVCTNALYALQVTQPSVPSQEYGIGEQYAAQTFKMLGGRMAINKHTQTGYRSGICLDGGACQIMSSNDGDQFLRGMHAGDPAYDWVKDITYLNGSRTTRWAPRMGVKDTAPNPTVTVSGVGTSYCDSGLYVSTYSTLTIDVADTTGDAGADFVFNESLTLWQNSAVRKTGVGTMRLNAESRGADDNTLSVLEGTVELGGAKVFAPGAPVLSLEGGTLSSAANVSNRLNTVTLAADSAISLASGSTLVFKDSSASAWTEGAKLSVTTADPTARLIFEGGQAALTSAQLRAIRMNGKRCQLNEDGSLAEYTPGLMLIFR